ncbi:MAG: bifunctional riboflavin kinase/FAD synthetase [Woeseia sp.]|nr:bifunctional riboflavin kinase/FAD synthetase [Woeseia sp.]MBT8097114.1 bifunctional riboflavin kinase/FAD synthetase [Woeseia sp.]NNE59828.1 bifunctional riboflavin kinase/FAD synthetase [Woeseia sp.]
MFLVRQTSNSLYERVARGSVVTIGAYDGMHLGHQRLLGSVVAEASQRRVPSVVMSFEPTPKEFFAKAAPPARLMRFREKFDALREAGVDIFYCPRFNEKMRDIKADTFIRQLLIQSLNTHHLVIGDDFQFAARREGNVEVLKRAGRALGFSVEQFPSVMIDGERVSSTAIRNALRRGDLAQAHRFLGRDYRMSGRVVRGKRLGRALGYPTANVNLNRRQGAVHGIFAVRVSGLGNTPLAGVASVGTRPTFAGTYPLLEVHLFDFDRDIYGRYIHVDFIARLRSEEKFDDAAALIKQMHRDSAAAREILAA